MSKIFILEDEEGAGRVCTVLKDAYKHEVTWVKDIRHAFFLLEEDPERIQYDAVILDLSVPGTHENYEISVAGNKVKRCYNDDTGMNGYLYFKDQHGRESDGSEKALTRYYENDRLGFYTAYGEQVKIRAARDGIDISRCKVFDKGEKEQHRVIHDWVKDLPEIPAE